MDGHLVGFKWLEDISGDSIAPRWQRSRVWRAYWDLLDAATLLQVGILILYTTTWEN
jgi:hypothetical protein